MEPKLIPKASTPVHHDKSLRAMSPRVERLYQLLQDRMTRVQRNWGGDLTLFDDPEIAVIAFAYNGGEGASVAGPIVRRTIEAYFELKTIDSRAGIP